ncbi:MAG: hypothetical protein WC859_09495 [Elusimicrobiota bacterium]|jgi:hypothetical protein
MRSFIFNFKRETPVLIFVACIFLACEVGLRLYGTTLSADLRHIREIPQIVAVHSHADRPTLLFLGNSLTRRGVIPEELMKDLSARGFSNVDIAKIHPDDTNMADWHYIYKRYVHSAGADPALLLIGFAEEQLCDSQRIHVDLLGGYFAGFDAVSEAFHYDVWDFSNRVDYLLDAVSSAYANRDRVRTQLLGAVIPYYKSSAQEMNKAIKKHVSVSEIGSYGRYKRLTRFLEFMKKSPTKVVFIAIPVPAHYPIDPTLESVIKENGSTLIDLRRPEGLTENDYMDNYHLSQQGGTVFTRELSRRLLDSAELRRSLR